MFDPAEILLKPGSAKAVPIKIVTEAGWKTAAASETAAARNWAQAHGFRGMPDTHLTLQDKAGNVSAVYAGLKEG